MSDYITNFLVVLAIVFALITSALGLSSVYISEAKADEAKISQQMEQLENLYNELYSFHQSAGFIKWGYGTQGRGAWADKVKELSKDKLFKSYIKTLIPEKVETEFLYQPLEPMFLWHLGRHYMNNSGQENKYSLAVKAQFLKLFKLHKSRRK